MFCDNCGKNINEVNNLQSNFMSYSLVPEKVKFFESKMDQTKSNKELSKAESDSQRHLKSSDYNFGDSLLKDDTMTTKSAPKTKNDGFIDFLVRPDDMKKLIDRANESIKSNFRAIRLIDKILKSKIN